MLVKLVEKEIKVIAIASKILIIPKTSFVLLKFLQIKVYNGFNKTPIRGDNPMIKPIFDSTKPLDFKYKAIKG